MQQTVAIDCPAEILLGLHLNAEDFADYLKNKLPSIYLKKAGYHQEPLRRGWELNEWLF